MIPAFTEEQQRVISSLSAKQLAMLQVSIAPSIADRMKEDARAFAEINSITNDWLLSLCVADIFGKIDISKLLSIITTPIAVVKKYPEFKFYALVTCLTSTRYRNSTTSVRDDCYPMRFYTEAEFTAMTDIAALREWLSSDVLGFKEVLPIPKHSEVLTTKSERTESGHLLGLYDPTAISNLEVFPVKEFLEFHRQCTLMRAVVRATIAEMGLTHTV